MRYLRTSEAAALLNVSPQTLRSWEERFHFPTTHRSPGGHRMFTFGEIAALRDALRNGMSTTSAVTLAREALSGGPNMLCGALLAFDRERAELALEAAMATKTVERTVEEVLLPTLDHIRERCGDDGAAWTFAAQWASEWLRRAQRIAPAPTRPVSMVLGDAVQDEFDPDAAYVRAFELFCVRSGIKVLTLSPRGVTGIRDAVAPHRPDLVVIAGGHLDDNVIGQWAYSVRGAAGPVPVMLFRRGERRRPLPTTGSAWLPCAPGEAQQQVLTMLHTVRRVADDAPSPPEGCGPEITIARSAS